MLDFSIIIPTKNEEKNILSCLDSINKNRYPQNKYEVIVVDNGSIDKTVAIAKSNGAVVTQIPDVNISALRNYGAQLATGAILVFIDADCTVAPDWLENASRYLRQSDIALFGSPPDIPLDSTWVQRTWLLVRGKRTQEVREVLWLESMNMFIPRYLFKELGGFNEDLITCEDVDMSYRLAEHGKVLSDLRIKAIHHGEARTIVAFFRKEKWRGKSNYSGLWAHGLKLAEVPSLFLPLYYLIMLVVVCAISLLPGGGKFFLLGSLMWQLPVCLVVLIKIRHDFSLKHAGRLWLLYNVYYCARSLAVF